MRFRETNLVSVENLQQRIVMILWLEIASAFKWSVRVIVYQLGCVCGGLLRAAKNLQFIVSQVHVTCPVPQDRSFEELLKTEGFLKTEDFPRLKIS